MHTSKLSIKLQSSEMAESIASALEPDNEGFVKVYVKRNVLYAECSAETVSSLRHTLDDFLRCLALAQRTLKTQ